MLGLAGSLRQSQRQAFLQLIPSQVRAELVTDGIAQLYGVTLGEPGVCLAVGTGSVVHWLDTEGVEGMAGGWGYPVGDQGSGAWLGMRALERYLAYRDGMVGSSALVDSIGKKIGEDVSAIQSWSTQSQASVMAALAPLVFESVARGDAAGKAMLAKAVEACIELIRCAPENLPVFVVGGIGQQLQSDLQTLLGSRLQQPRADALHGLWLLSQR